MAADKLSPTLAILASLAAYSLSACQAPLRVEPADWPGFGRDHDNSRFNPAEDVLTADTVGSAQELWRIEGSAATGTPTIALGRGYIGMWDGSLSVFDPVSGVEQARVGISAFALTASVAIGSEAVYAGDGGGVMHAISRERHETLWRRAIDPHPDAFVFSSPVLVDDLLIVGSASAEVATQKDDYTFRGSVVALDAWSGNERWRTYLTGDDDTSGAGVSVWSSAAVDRERRRLFIGTGQSYETPTSPYSDGLVALDLDSGAVVWHRQFTPDDVYTLFMPPPRGPDADVGAAPNLFEINDRPVVGVGDKAGVYTVLDRGDGATVWATQLTPGSHLGGVMVAAAVAEGHVFVVSNVFDTVDAVPNRSSHAMAFALRIDDGVADWTAEIASPCYGAVSVAGGVVYFGSTDGHIYGLAAKSGAVLLDRALGRAIASGPIVSRGRLLVPFGMSFFDYSPEVPGGLVALGIP